MHIDKKMIYPYLIAFGLNLTILTVLGVTSYLLIDTLESLLVKSTIAGCIITIIWTYVIYSKRTHTFERYMTTFAILFIMLLISLGVALSGKNIQQKNYPESFVPL